MALKRAYFLVAVGVLELIVGGFLIRAAAEPLSVSQNITIPSGGYHHIEFGILTSGRLSGFFSGNKSVDFLVFDDPGYASFVSGSNLVPPISTQNGTSVSFLVPLNSSGQYHLIFGDFPAREELLLHLDLLMIGLKTSGTLLGVFVLIGGWALLAAALMIGGPSGGGFRRRRKSETTEPPAGDGSSDASSNPLGSTDNQPVDDTRIYR